MGFEEACLVGALHPEAMRNNQISLSFQLEKRCSVFPAKTWQAVRAHALPHRELLSGSELVGTMRTGVSKDQAVFLIQLHGSTADLAFSEHRSL